MFASLLMLFVVGLITLVVLSVVFAVVGAALSLAGILLFKVAPILLLGWIVVRLVRGSGSGGDLSPADRKWLDG